MRTVNVDDNAIELGYKGENEATQVIFDVRGWDKIYGDGTFGLVHQRAIDDVPYPCVVTVEDGFVKWVVGAADVDIVGRGRCELRYADGEGLLVKSIIYDTIVRESLGTESLTPPEPWEAWVDQVQNAATTAANAAETASGAAEAATNAASSITNLTVSSQPLPAGTPPYVNKTQPSGQPINLEFGIPVAINSFWIGTQDEYDNLPTHYNNTAYLIVEDMETT